MDQLRRVIERALADESFRRSLLDDVPATLAAHGIELSPAVVVRLDELREASRIRYLSGEELLEELFADPEFEDAFRAAPTEALVERNLFVNDVVVRQLHSLLDDPEVSQLRREYREAEEPAV